MLSSLCSFGYAKPPGRNYVIKTFLGFEIFCAPPPTWGRMMNHGALGNVKYRSLEFLWDLENLPNVFIDDINAFYYILSHLITTSWTHWGLWTPCGAIVLLNIFWVNGSAPVQCLAICWTKTNLLTIGQSGPSFGEISRKTCHTTNLIWNCRLYVSHTVCFLPSNK